MSDCKEPPSGRGAAGKWTDAATGEHGDLLDLIAHNRALNRFRDILDEARAFLSLPRPQPQPSRSWSPASKGSAGAARRLFRAGYPVPATATPAEAHLRARGITTTLDWPCLRFHPSVLYRAHADASCKSLPALLAAVTDAEGRITGVQRTWLDPARHRKAGLINPRRALGGLLGNGVRFGIASDVLAVGRGDRDHAVAQVVAA